MKLTSYNGWTASDKPESIHIKSYAIPGTTLKIRCAEAVAPLIVGFCKEFNELIEPLDGGQLDDWGYAFRSVRNVPDKLSNHASGTAVDLNSRVHVLGKVGTFPAEKVPMIRALARKYGLFWGGDYQKRADEMHFEINVSPKKVLELINALGLGEK
jgi:hypothetical protein